MGCKAHTRAAAARLAARREPRARACARARARVHVLGLGLGLGLGSWQLVFGLFFGPGHVTRWLGSTLGWSNDTSVV